MYLFFAFSGLNNAIISTLFGSLVFWKNRKNKVNQTFALFCFAVACWSYAYIFWPLAETADSALFWFQILHVGASFTSVAYLLFVVTWLGMFEKNKIIIYIGFFLAFFFSYLVFSPHFIADMVPKFSMKYWAVPGILYHFYLVFFFGYFFYSSYILLCEYRKALGSKKIQIRYILIGIGLAFLGGSTNYPLWYNINFPPYGNILVSAYVFLTGYAIVAHRLMDIKMVMRSSSVYLASLISILLFAVGANSIFYHFAPDFIYWTNLVILILAISAFPSVKNKFYNWANLYFFTSLYDPQKLIAGLSDHLRTTLQVDSIYRYIFESLDSAFHFKAFGVLSYSEKSNMYNLDFNKGFDVKSQTKFFNNLQLYKIFISQNKIMVTEELLKNYYDEKNKEIIDLLVELKVEILVPLNVKNRIVGLIALGPKESNDMYNDVDLQTLEIISAQAATAIENAHLYEKTLNFNLKLKDEVEKATRELVAANKKLIKLDEAKSEFISIASHQLRTPLTIIKGYISMILEGNFGELTPGEKDSLDKVYLSNERLIQLVENLLNISRIESGRLQFDYKEMQLSDIIDSVVEELEPKAKGKGLKFTYKKAKKKMPNINIDEEKIRQVVMNLIDNAIKYTKKGSVTVSLDMVKPRDPKMPMCLEFKVADSGMGISADDLPNLFKKFSRGTGSSLVHTEGTGLGLYVARQMIEAHHGKIWAESVGENKGSKFCFRIFLDNPEAKLVAEKKEEKKKVKKVKT